MPANKRQGTSVERYYQNKRKQKKRQKRNFYIFLALLALGTFFVLSLTVFFNIKQIQIEGNLTYTEQQLLEAAGIEKGDNLFRLNKFKIKEKMCAALPYLGQVDIYRKLPTTLCITVTETKPILFVAQNSGDYFLLDRNLKVLEAVSEVTDAKPMIELRGDAMVQYTPGTTAAFEGASESYLGELIGEIEQTLSLEQVDIISIEDKFNINIYYGEMRLKILAGSMENMKEKLELVQYVIEQNPSNEQARIDITNGKTAYYQPLQEGETLDSNEISQPEQGEESAAQNEQPSEESDNKDENADKE